MRDAVAASVTYPAPSRASSQVSVVVTVPSRVRFSRSQAIFGAAKYGSSGRPVIAASSAARSASRAQTLPDRRSCQTIAGDSGLPVPRSQASTVSPWLASATALAAAPAAVSARRPAARTEANSSSGSASTPSAPTLRVPTGTSPRPSTSAPGPTRSALVADVPWSMARMFTPDRAPGRARCASPLARSPSAPHRTPDPGRARRARSTARPGTPPGR